MFLYGCFLCTLALRGEDESARFVPVHGGLFFLWQRSCLLANWALLYGYFYVRPRREGEQSTRCLIPIYGSVLFCWPAGYFIGVFFCVHPRHEGSKERNCHSYGRTLCLLTNWA